MKTATRSRATATRRPIKRRPAKHRPAGTAARPANRAIDIDIDANRRLLNNYRYIEHEALLQLAGWLPRTATFELKCEMGRSLWEYSQHVNSLYLRLREIQSPAFQKPTDAALVRLVTEMLNAPDEFAFACGLYRVVLPSLIASLESHETATFPNSDQPSVHVIAHALLDRRDVLARDGAAEGFVDELEAQPGIVGVRGRVFGQRLDAQKDFAELT